MNNYTLKNPIQAVKIDVDTDMTQFNAWHIDEEGIAYIQPLPTDIFRSCVPPCYIFRNDQGLWWQNQQQFENTYQLQV